MTPFPAAGPPQAAASPLLGGKSPTPASGPCLVAPLAQPRPQCSRWKAATPSLVDSQDLQTGETADPLPYSVPFPQFELLIRSVRTPLEQRTRSRLALPFAYDWPAPTGPAPAISPLRHTVPLSALGMGARAAPPELQPDGFLQREEKFWNELRIAVRSQADRPDSCLRATRVSVPASPDSSPAPQSGSGSAVDCKRHLDPPHESGPKCLRGPLLRKYMPAR